MSFYPLVATCCLIMLAAFLWFVGSHNAALLVGAVTLFMMALAAARWRDI